jgi:parallel beta-helix repeat protein
MNLKPQTSNLKHFRMRSLLTITLLIIFQTAFSQTTLKAGMKINKSTKFKKATVTLTSASLDKPVIVISGENMVVDFSQVVLKGSGSSVHPDEFKGLAVLVKSGKNITIKNLNARGYKVALLARNVEGLVLENCDFSYNYRQRLNSTQQKEDISDWMSYHHNEKDEWLRYGAAIYLADCNKTTVRNCKVTGGQNALMMTRCSNGTIYNNEFSFNSGIGIGLYRSSSNKILYNKLNFNVRGYSHGVYSRGQDSAGILVYEQSSNNVFYKNSVTHSGDGFFLWAGQTTMDTGEGGCNDNLIMDNDFSYAPTNGIEVTFSRNKIIHNRIFECDHGIWGGYSFQTLISQNQFRNNRIGIAIEHGQDNQIVRNLFYRDKEAIRLWARREQPSDWGYARHRDTRSRNYTLAVNSFNSNPLIYNISRTDSIRIFENLHSNYDQLFKADSTVTNVDSSGSVFDVTELEPEVPTVPSPIDPFKGRGGLSGRRNILMTEWGPYNFGYPLLWNSNPTDSSDTLRLDLLGPKGKWKVISARGVEGLSARSGSFPAQLTAAKTASERTDIEVIAEYTGPTFTDGLGNKIAANKPHRFAFRRFFQPIGFSVSWYSFDSLSSPIKDTAYLEHLKTQRPFKAESSDRLDYAWWGGIKHNDQTYKQFLTVAEGSAEFPPATYELSITWDDAVRVYIDGKRLINEWNPSKYTFDESPNKKIRVKLSGLHTFRVEHVELGGFATLSLKFRPIKE